MVGVSYGGCVIWWVCHMVGVSYESIKTKKISTKKAKLGTRLIAIVLLLVY